MSSTSSTTNLAISGLASGFDWQSLVTQLIQVERAPETNMRTAQTKLQQRNNAYQSIGTQLGVLSNRVNSLKDPSLFDARQTSLTDATVATATAGSGTSLGTYTFKISQLASAASQLGEANVAGGLSGTNNVSSLALGSAGFASPITPGTFTVNGKTITIATTDTLQSVFDQISSITGGTVSGGYDATSDKISFTSGSPIVLGSATDTSNFLQAAKLYNTGTGAIYSASSLGGVNSTASLASSNLGTTVTDGGSGAGQFLINGVAINYSATADSTNDVLNRINDSAAGVTASYDAVNDRFQLTNKSTGDMGISLQDVTGNFLAATKLSSGTLQRGANLQYSINGGGTLSSQSSIISADSSGLTGLSVTALKAGTTTVTVGTNTASISSAINDFVTEYNRTQSLIDSQTASTTDSTGKVTAGILTGDSEANGIASALRHLTTNTASGLSGILKNLESLGISSNGNDNTLTVSDSTKLSNALTNNLSGVKNLFTNATNGLATSLSTYLDTTVGDTGSLASHETSLTKQSTDIDTNIANMERTILDDQSRLTSEFVAMETAQAAITQQQAYLTKSFP